MHKHWVNLEKYNERPQGSLQFICVITKLPDESFPSPFGVSVNFYILCIVTTSYCYSHFECSQYIYYIYNPITLVLSHLFVFLIMFFVLTFKHI